MLVSLALAAILVVIGARALLAPAAAAANFGLPLAANESPDWVRIYGGRTIVLGAIVALAAIRRAWAALSAVFAIALLLPAVDIAVVSGRSPPASSMIVHLAIAAVVAALAFWAWRRSRAVAAAGGA
ncbi:MAG: DUF4267 domain-containing protein [Beijerinckiaceae bacterium]